MAAYNIDGNDLSTTERVYISDIRRLHPSYDDDALLDAAIAKAAAMGGNVMIVWDGRDIHFAGSVTHECKGFGGIDFGGAKIYMPNYDLGIILQIVPESSADVTASASEIGKSRTSKPELQGKVFTIYGNDDMCLGNRQPEASYPGQIMYYTQAVLTTDDGTYTTGELFLTPQSGDVEIKNVHDYPEITFELCNGIIITNAGSNMSEFALCTRSNAHIHNFVLNGRSGVTSFHNGVFRVTQCVNIEVDHIKGINPMVYPTSGYFIGIGQTSFIHVHDIYVGDSLSWGSIGGRYVCNATYERCHLNRWDSHFAQFGVNTIKGCVLGQVSYGVGSGKIIVEDCIIQKSEHTNSILLRPDCIGVYDGDIIVRDCKFETGVQSADQMTVWSEIFRYKQPSNTMVNYAPNRLRLIERCTIPDGCAGIFSIGTTDSTDKALFENLTYMIRDTRLACPDTIVKAQSNGQTVKGVVLEGCEIASACYLINEIAQCALHVSRCSAGTNDLRIRINSGITHVSDSGFGAVVSDQQSAALTLTGCSVNGEQSFGQFTNYAAYGNISGRGTQYTAALNASV